MIVILTNTAWKGSVFSRIRTEYGEILRIQSECEKIRTRKYSVFEHISHSEISLSDELLAKRQTKCFKFLVDKDWWLRGSPFNERFGREAVFPCSRATLFLSISLFRKTKMKKKSWNSCDIKVLCGTNEELRVSLKTIY